MKNQDIMFACMLAAIVLSGCVSEKGNELVPVNKTVTCNKPYILVAGSCCLDINDNRICDVSETTLTTMQTTTTTGGASAATTPQVTSTVASGTCSDGIKNQGETQADCGGPCKSCPTPCDLAVNATGVKPAARTTKLCLSNAEPVVYEGLNITVKGSGSDESEVVLVAVDEAGTRTEYTIRQGKDIAVGKVMIRPIGSGRMDSGLYTAVYAWVSENEITCSTNADCGAERLTGYACQGVKYVVKQILYYRCLQPGTVMSECQALQKTENVAACGESERCSAGEDACFPKECFDDVQDKDESGADCGGSCRPCHCFNNVRDEMELGVDCGADCKPCITVRDADKTPPAIKIKSPANRVYSKRMINLTYDVNEPVAWCGYSLNGGPGVTVKGNWSIYAQPGANELVLYCNDSWGNMNYSRMRFNVSLIQGMICPDDPVSVSYSDNFDSVAFYVDAESELGVPDMCTTKVFEYALTYVNDLDAHAKTLDATEQMLDRGLSAGGDAILSYRCTRNVLVEAGYAKVKKNVDVRTLSRMKALVYFLGNKSPEDISSFWRVYYYGADGNSVDMGKYIDIPYMPVASSCRGRVNASYQELDLTPLLDRPENKAIDLRIGFYTTSLATELSVQEMELYTETQRG